MLIFALGHGHTLLGVRLWYFCLSLQPPPLYSQKQQKPSEKKTAKVTLKGLRCANHSASQPRGWNLTVDCPASLSPCQGVWSQGTAGPGKANPRYQQTSPWFYLKETQKKRSNTYPCPPLTSVLPFVTISLGSFAWDTFLPLDFSGMSPERLTPALKPSAWKASVPQATSG